MSEDTAKCTCCTDSTSAVVKVKLNLKIKGKLKPALLPSDDKLPSPMRPLALGKTAAAAKVCAKGVYTITFGDVAENGIGMEQLGQIYGRGLRVQELVDAH